MEKLASLSTNNSIDLNLAEALLYGVEYADKLPIEDFRKEDDNE